MSRGKEEKEMEGKERRRLLLFVGWICPVCGRVYSPSVYMCPCEGVPPKELKEDEETMEDD